MLSKELFPKEMRQKMVAELRTLTTEQRKHMREYFLLLFREADGFAPVTQYDDQSTKLAGILAGLMPVELRTVIRSAKVIRKNADREARNVWRHTSQQLSRGDS